METRLPLNASALLPAAGVPFTLQRPDGSCLTPRIPTELFSTEASTTNWYGGRYFDTNWKAEAMVHGNNAVNYRLEPALECADFTRIEQDVFVELGPEKNRYCLA